MLGVVSREHFPLVQPRGIETAVSGMAGARRRGTGRAGWRRAVSTRTGVVGSAVRPGGCTRRGGVKRITRADGRGSVSGPTVLRDRGRSAATSGGPGAGRRRNAPGGRAAAGYLLEDAPSGACREIRWPRMDIPLLDKAASHPFLVPMVLEALSSPNRSSRAVRRAKSWRAG